MDKKKIILDVDTGSDDAIAIMTAVLSDELDVLGITTVNGNRPVMNDYRKYSESTGFIKVGHTGI